MAMEIVDPRSAEHEITDVQTLEEIKTIVPYFPDDERMSRYICYVSSGWTRKEARIRAGIDYDTYKKFLLDDKFREIDELPYNELRERVGNAYAELKARKNTITWMEFDEEFLSEIQRKLAAKEELTKDERAIFLKRAAIYTPETINVGNKIANNVIEDDNSSGSAGFDIAVFVRQRKGS